MAKQTFTTFLAPWILIALSSSLDDKYSINLTRNFTKVSLQGNKLKAWTECIQKCVGQPSCEFVLVYGKNKMCFLVDFLFHDIMKMESQKCFPLRAFHYEYFWSNLKQEETSIKPAMITDSDNEIKSTEANSDIGCSLYPNHPYDDVDYGNIRVRFDVGTTVTVSCSGYYSPGLCHRGEAQRICNSSNVWNQEETPCYLPKNVALEKSASQISDYYHDSPLTAHLAVQGYRESFIFGQLSCAHTDYSINPWWEVDLNGSYPITEVHIYNRQECCQERLVGAEVTIIEGHSSTVIGNVDDSNCFQEPIVFRPQDAPVNGSKVRIDIKSRAEYLTLCEVEVYSCYF